MAFFVEVVRPVFEQLVARGLVAGHFGIGVPNIILVTIREYPPPAAVQAVANLLGQAAL